MNRKEREWNDLYNEGGEGYNPHTEQSSNPFRPTKAERVNKLRRKISVALNSERPALEAELAELEATPDWGLVLK